MEISVKPKEAAQIKSDGILQQTNWWAPMKYHQGYYVKSFRISLNQKHSGYHHDDLLVILRHEKEGNCMAYIPYGPEIEPRGDEKGIFLENLAVKIKPYLPDNCTLIRFDLKWEAPWINDENRYNNLREWEGIPGEQTQELRMNFCTEHHNLYKAPSDVLPSSTVYLNLKNTKHQLLYNMKPKTRYNIRLSNRRNINVREAGANELGKWHHLYRQTAKRNRFFCHSLSSFESILYANNNTKNSNAGSSLLIAEHNHEPLAAMWLGFSGSQATYLYGASASHKRNMMPTYALQWEAICRSKQMGCKYYDMFGVSPTSNLSHPMYGLFQFKIGFGGTRLLRYGCWDYPFDHSSYQYFRCREMKATGYHLS